MIIFVELLHLNRGPIRTNEINVESKKQNKTKAAVRRTGTLCHRPGQNHCLSAEKRQREREGEKPVLTLELTLVSLHTQQTSMFAHVALFYTTLY